MNRIHQLFLSIMVSLIPSNFVFSSETPTGTPTPAISDTPTNTPYITPSITPDNIPTNTPVPVYSKDWVEFSPGSASGQGISKGFGNPQQSTQIIIDKDDEPVIAWDSLLDGYDYSVTHIMKWEGNAWKELVKENISSAGIVAGLNRITIDPADQSIVLSTDFYSNILFKFDGTIWKPWANGGIDDPDGLEIWTDIAFLPDNTPVAFYHHMYAPSPYHYRVKKFVDGSWKEFNPGSATDNGIADSNLNGLHPQIYINFRGDIYTVWQQNYFGHQAIYLKRWTGIEWITELIALSSNTGDDSDSCWLGFHPICFDSEGYPILTYQKVLGNKSIIEVVKKVNDKWKTLGYVESEERGLCSPGHKGGLSIILNTPWDYPIVFWYDSPSNALYAKYFDGMEWKPLGEGAASDGGIGNLSWSNFSATINKKNEIILAYTSADTKDIYVKKYQLTPPENYQPPTPTPAPTPIPGWFVLDGFGGVHGSNPAIPLPVLPYFMPFNIARDLEPDPLGRGWYMLDGFGGIHTSPPDLPKPTGLPYFGYDIARNLEIVNTDHGYEFYMLDGYGAVHSTDKNFNQGYLPWFGFDIARDLEPFSNADAWNVLDGYGLMYSSKESIESYPLQSIWSWNPLVRSIVSFPDHTNVVMDAWGGRHTNPRKPATDVVKGLPGDFYFPGFDIIWDLELAPIKNK